MGGVCRARNCFRSKDKCPDLPFFTFPKNPISAKKWIANIGDPELLKRPPSALKNNVVCALHFEEKCFVNKKKRTLVRNAVPTIFNIPPLRTQEIHKNAKHSKFESTDVSECSSGAVFSCDVETLDNWHHQIDAVTEQLLCLLPENSSHTPQLEPHTEKRCVDAYTQYETESDSREFENRLNDLNKDTNGESNGGVPKVQLLCRLCSKLIHRENVIAVFSFEGEKIHLEDMINNVLPMKVIQDDGLPQQVCNLCVRKLTFCHELRLEFLASDKRLRDLLGIAEAKDSSEIPGTKAIVEKEQSTVQGHPSAEVITLPAEDAIKVQLKENEPPPVLPETNETTITQSETLKRGPRKRKNLTDAVKNKNTRKKADKIPKLTKPSPRGSKTPDEDISKLIKPGPHGKKITAEDIPKLIKTGPHGKKSTGEETPKFVGTGLRGKKSIGEETPKLVRTGPHGKKSIVEETPKLVRTGPHGKKFTGGETPKLVRTGQLGKKSSGEETLKLGRSGPRGKKSIGEEIPKLIKAGPHGRKSTAVETPKLVRTGPHGRKSVGEETPKLVRTGSHGKKSASEEIPKVVTIGLDENKSISEEIPKLGNTGPHEKEALPEEIPNLVETVSHKKMATTEEIPNLDKTGPLEKKTTTEESDFENDSNYEIHWYDEAYDDSISEDMGTSDSILNSKKMLLNNAKKPLTSETAKLVTDPITDVETKSIKENNITTLNHKKLNESKLDDSMEIDSHVIDSKVNENKEDDRNINENKVNTSISVPVTNSHPSLKESTLGSVSIRQKIGSGSVKVRLMTERQKLLKLKLKTQNKLLKQGSKKKVLPPKNSCSECKKSFSSKLKLERHILMHNKFECAVCSTIFNNAEELSSHSKENCLSKLKAVTDAAAAAHECEVCKRTFKSHQRLLIHSKTHSTTIPYACNVCPKAFPTRIRLKQHLKSHKPEKSFKCLICHQSFKTNNSLFRHRVHHSMSSQRDQHSVSSQRDQHSVSSQRDQHSISSQRDQHSISSQRDQHSISSQRDQHSISSQRDQHCISSQRDQHSISSQRDQHSISSQRDQYSVSSQRVQHQESLHRIHSESALTLKCETCSASFTNVKEYEKHREEHASSSPTIHVNGASTAEITSDVPVDNLGNGSGSFVDTSSVVADVQGVELTKTLKEDGIMKVKVPHLEKNLIITSADQFVCDICDCKFSSKHFQEEHKKIHHSLPKMSSVSVATSPVETTVELPQTPERGKLYFCDQCGEGYERKRSLALHRFSHTSSHRCPHCHQSFSSEDSLTRHLENCSAVKEETSEGNSQL